MAITDPPELEEIPLPEPPGLLGGWGAQFETTLVRWTVRVFNRATNPLLEVWDNAVEYFLGRVADEISPVLRPFLDSLDEAEDLPQSVRNLMGMLRGTPPLPLLAIGIGLFMILIGALIGSSISPIAKKLGYKQERISSSARLPPREAFAGWKRRGLTEIEFDNQLADMGWDTQKIGVWKSILRPLLTISDTGRLFLREEISSDAFDTELEMRGYRSTEIAQIKTLLEVIPPLPDIIRMAVREAFTPDIVSRFELHAELPAEMVAWAKKQGLSNEWAKAYWASHWTLPGLSLGYEMLHRGVIDNTEMQLLIKAQDVSPFWRDKLLEISYSPYTRVDVRRMYKAGVIERPEVKRTYLDLGYNEEKAENLTDFTVALANATERDLTKTDVLWGFEVGYFNPGEATELLVGMGYDSVEATYYLAKVEYKRWQKTVSETIKYIGQQYIANQISEAEVYIQLGQLNLPAEQMNRLVRGWDLKKQAKTKRLTADRLLKFRVSNVINDDEFRNEMSGIGYSERYITWYLNSIQPV